ncbi:MAG TPA: zinc-binding alcohol dehydrogenase family protein, partial [Tepidisphaeraceae bacterium]
GVVERVGIGVHDWNEGDVAVLLRGEVGVERWGTFAEKVLVPREYLVKVPAGWTQQESAGAPLVYLTAYQALTQWGEIPRRSVVLVTGASGGVGIATIQLSRAMGLRPIGLSRGPARREALAALGAEKVYDPMDDDWVAQVKRDLKDQRVTLAVDNVAGSIFDGVIATLGHEGKVSLVGRSGGEVRSFNTGTLFFRRLKIGGVAVGTYIAGEARAAWDAVVKLLATTGAKPVIDQVFPFEDLPAAFERMASDHLGKELIEVEKSARDAVVEGP